MSELKPTVEIFVERLTNEIAKEYAERYSRLTPKPATFTEGGKYFKILHDGSCWGFISKYDGIFKNRPIKVGDLLKSANWSSPAKHSRGNILEGTEAYNIYGPEYRK